VHHARLYATAEAARSEAERANRAKDEFLAMLGHELRNPLAPMLTALQLMKMRTPDAVARERAILERQMNHVVQLVDDLLDVSRITRGKIDLARAPVGVAETVRKALEVAAPVIEEKRHHVAVDVPSAAFILGDQGRLVQVFANLIVNAAKYTNAGGRIDVQVRRAGANWEARVRDNGVGISRELLPRVFDLFAQGAQPLNRDKGGLGLGLAIVRSIVERHDGRVIATSDGEGKGSEFLVVLPAADGVHPTPELQAPRPALARVRNTRVLVVDDNEDALELLADALGHAGFEVYTATDAASALVRAQASKPEVALLDIGLPVMDGYELAQRLRELPDLTHAKLIALTGYGQEADKRRAKEAGFVEHLVKPISLEHLEQTLARIVASGEDADAKQSDERQ
jgi:CheY-like chemotaxis protein